MGLEGLYRMITAKLMYRALIAGSIGLLSWSAATAFAGHDDVASFPFIEYDEKPILYEKADRTDPVALLTERLAKGETLLTYDAQRGYLPSLLKALDINVDSQILVFSKTSFQAQRISPTRPRALYFNDTVSVGSVQDGRVLEIASLDPRQGVMFYSLGVSKSEKPLPRREGIACLGCHLTSSTLNIPGILIATVYPRADGTPASSTGYFATDHRIPINERWGGWFVTGAKGAALHKGNSIAREFEDFTKLSGGNVNLTSLSERFDTSRYLTDTSDIVALLVVEHQTRITNLITRLGWETRIAIEEGKLDDDAFKKRLDDVAELTATYMLFADEAPILEPIEGSSSFSKTFPQRGPRDKQGRSFRDFDLKTRLFRYPLSYMIYSEAFDSLPPVARESVLRKLFDVLEGKNRDVKFARLTDDSRRAILEILRDTKPGLTR
jgi:hypothetical protein